MYNGDFLNDKRHGIGEIKWSSGNIYYGEFKNDEKDGKGEMWWANDNTYIGEWYKGKRHGLGTLKKEDGEIITGVFDNNIFMGQGFVSPTKSVENQTDLKIESENNNKTNPTLLLNTLNSPSQN